MKTWIDKRRTATAPFDIIWEDDSPGDDPEAASTLVRMWADAGVTWWLESVWNGPRTARGIAGMHGRIRQGQPVSGSSGRTRMVRRVSFVKSRIDIR